MIAAGPSDNSGWTIGPCDSKELESLLATYQAGNEEGSAGRLELFRSLRYAQAGDRTGAAASLTMAEERFGGESRPHWEIALLLAARAHLASLSGDVPNWRFNLREAMLFLGSLPEVAQMILSPILSAVPKPPPLSREPISPLEQSLARNFVAGDTEARMFLRQLDSVTQVQRERTDVGVFIKLLVSADVPTASRTERFSGKTICLEHPDLEAGAYATLHFRDGRIDTLELATNQGMWPANESLFEVR